MNLRTLSDDELIRHAEIQEPVVVSDVEREILRRWSSQLHDGPQKLLSELRNAGIEDDDDVGKLLELIEFSDVASGFCIDLPGELRERLQRLENLESLLEDMAIDGRNGEIAAIKDQLLELNKPAQIEP